MKTARLRDMPGNEETLRSRDPMHTVLVDACDSNNDVFVGIDGPPSSVTLLRVPAGEGKVLPLPDGAVAVTIKIDPNGSNTAGTGYVVAAVSPADLLVPPSFARPEANMELVDPDGNPIGSTATAGASILAGLTDGAGNKIGSSADASGAALSVQPPSQQIALAINQSVAAGATYQTGAYVLAGSRGTWMAQASWATATTGAIYEHYEFAAGWQGLLLNTQASASADWFTSASGSASAQAYAGAPLLPTLWGSTDGFQITNSGAAAAVLSSFGAYIQ